MGDSEIHERYFSTVPETMHNLIIICTFYDALAVFILAIKAESPTCFILSWLYICLASMTIMNMLIGVLCEVIQGVAEEEKEAMMVDKVNEKFAGVVRSLDTDSNGSLSWTEFKCLLDHEDAVPALNSVNVDPEVMIDMAEE